MPTEGSDRPHINLGANGESEAFTSPQGRGREFRTPGRDRARHGALLRQQLSAAEEMFSQLAARRARDGFADQDGLLLTFVSDPGHELKLESLESEVAGIELLAVRRAGDRTEASVRVPPGKLSIFERKVKAYLESETKKGNPRNQPLVDSIAEIRVAALEQLWTDSNPVLPVSGEKVWWEVWLRGRDVTGVFTEHAERLGIHVQPGHLSLVDRTVHLVHATRDEMAASVEFLDCIAELRLAKTNPEEFLRLENAEQAEWVEGLVERITWPSPTAPAVCLLDTGVNRGHPLLSPALADQDLLACNPGWGVADSDARGHGTAMAGIALYGDDLADLLAGNAPVTLRHRLESVKLLPPRGRNELELYGLRTQEAVGRAEINAPKRARCFCSTITDRDGRDRGAATSWSAAVDAEIFGPEGGEPRLLVQSAGNVPPERWTNYPDSCHVEGIHDPGQAWNALTVGATTNRFEFDPNAYPGCELLAAPGGLSPCSTTSLTWDQRMPVKPDLVLEGGNALKDTAGKHAGDADSLRLLSTHHEPTRYLLTVAGETSAAAAQCGRMVAILQAEYPNLRPETTRALLVHSADWTDTMRAEFPPTNSPGRRKLLRTYGFGIPNLARAVWSASNRLTLIVEDQLTPFRLDGDGVKTNEMKLHELPWPKDVLLGLGEVEVELRVTLSYYVEPSPGQRGETKRYGYASHGLRFDLIRPAEKPAAFRKRLNKAARVEEEDRSAWASESDAGWTIGANERSRGSIHSDRWKGTAAALATRSLVGVYPVSGWWRTRKRLERWDRRARYSLVVSIHTPSETMDVYTPVATRVPVPIPAS